MCKKTFLAVIMVLILLATSVVGVYASDEDLYKNLDDTANQSGDDYFVNYRDNYELDTEEMSVFKDLGSFIINVLASFVFLLQKMLGQLTISIFAFSLSNNLTTMFGQLIEPFISAMKSGIWDNLAVYAIAFAGFAMLIKIAQNRTTQAMLNLVSLVFIIVLAFTFYAYPVEMLEGVDLVVSGVSDEVMEGPYNQIVGGTAGDATGKATALCWNMFVHKPWQILEFGSIKTATKYQDDILKLKPGSDARRDKVEELAKSEGLFSKSGGNQFFRLVTGIIMLLFNLILMAVILTFSVLIVGYRFLLLIYLILGTLVFVVALIPGCGISMVKKWGMRIISVSFTRVLVVFFLSLTLLFLDTIYQYIDKDGYGLYIVMFLMIVTVFALWFERYRILDLFSGYKSGGNQVPQAMQKSFETDFNAVDRLRKIRKTSMEKMNKWEPQSEGLGEGVGANTNKAYENRRGAGYGGNTFEIEGIKRAGEKLELSADKLNSVSQDMEFYYRQAGTVLQKHYDVSKGKADEMASERGEKPEYDSFVKRTDKLRAKGGGEFDRQDIQQVANIIKSTVRQGGSIADIETNGVTIGKTQQQTERPKSLEKLQSNSMNINSPIKAESGKNVERQGIEYFRSNFGEEKGEEMYGKLQTQYGKEKMEKYQPTYQNSGKQTFAQVVKQLSTNEASVKKTEEPIKLREGGKSNEKQNNG